MKDTDEETTVARVKGSVYRGDVLMFFPPDGCLLADYSINFVWKAGQDLSYFRILEEENLMLNVATKDTSIELFIDSEFFVLGKAYRWEVGSTNPPPQNYPPFHFTISSNEQLADFENRLQELKKALNYPDDMKYMILVGFCASEKCFMMAIDYFTKASELTDDPQMVEQAYAAFLESIMRME